MQSTIARYSGRLHRIDVLRGIAVVFMVVFHFFVIPEGGAIPVTFLFALELYWIGHVSATLFLLLFGVSFSLVEHRYQTIGAYLWRRLPPLALVAGLTTIVTLAVYPDETIVFGIFQLLSVSAVLLWVFRRHPVTSLVMGIMILVIGHFTYDTYVSFSWLIPLGLRPPEFTSLDYYPILPYFGYILIGYFLGTRLWSIHAVLAYLARRGGYLESSLASIGRHALPIYIVHIVVIWFFWQWYLGISLFHNFS